MNCQTCHKAFRPKRATAKYCSPGCRQEAFRQRHNIPKPSFLNSTKNKETIGLLVEKQQQNTTTTSDSANNELLNLLMQKKQYCLNRLNEIQNRQIMPFATVGGCIVGTAVVDKESLLIGGLIGGILGYNIGKTIDANSAIINEQMKDSYLRAIKDIEEQIKVLKKSEATHQTNNKPSFSAPYIKTEKGAEIINSHDLQNLKMEQYEFIEPYRSFFGNPSKPFSAIVYGLPKSGKSNFCIQLASYLSRNFGKVLYVSAEEGTSKSLVDKLQFQLAHSSNLDITPTRSINEIQKAVKGYDFVFLDSVNISQIDAPILETLKANNPNTSFISVIQSTKNGNFKGSQEFAHNCDIVVKVDSGKAYQSGRFNPASEYQIF
jgi:hypothetical protein